MGLCDALCYVMLDEDILIENLHPTTSYVFQVRAVNEVGVGLQKRITVTTDNVRKWCSFALINIIAVSYTHLTLPTNREV